MKLKEKAMANKNKTENKPSTVIFNGRFWIAPDGRKFNSRLQAEQYVSGSTVDSKS